MFAVYGFPLVLLRKVQDYTSDYSGLFRIIQDYSGFFRIIQD